MRFHWRQEIRLCNEEHAHVARPISKDALSYAVAGKLRRLVRRVEALLFDQLDQSKALAAGLPHHFTCSLPDGNALSVMEAAQTRTIEEPLDNCRQAVLSLDLAWLGEPLAH